MKKFFIVGMPASGKSRLGKYISSMTDLCFIDLDLEIEKKLDSNVKDIFEIKGEKFFRKFETKTLKEIIESESNFILTLKLRISLLHPPQCFQKGPEFRTWSF